MVQAVRHFLPGVIVLDDASSDGTAAAATSAGAQVLTQPRPAGKGTALRRAWQRAHEQGFRWALSLDGDGQHRPDDIPAFFAKAEETNAALLIGNRMHDATSMPFVRRHVNRWMSRRLGVLLDRTVPDSQCGFRLMDLRAWAGLRIEARHFEIESEVLLKFVLAGFGVEFIPVQTVYGLEKSKISPVLDTFRWFRWWLQARKFVRLQASSKHEHIRFGTGAEGNRQQDEV